MFCFLMSGIKSYIVRKSSKLRLKFLPAFKILVLEGPLGVLKYKIDAKLNYRSFDNKLWLSPTKRIKKSLYGINQVLLVQASLGVVLGYRKQLNLVGIGYQASLEKEGNNFFLVLKLGYSHSIRLQVPSYLCVICPKPRIVLITGINLQRVNNFASAIRYLKLPNVYKEKGLYYKNESFKLKQGKKT